MESPNSSFEYTAVDELNDEITILVNIIKLNKRITTSYLQQEISKFCKEQHSLISEAYCPKKPETPKRIPIKINTDTEVHECSYTFKSGPKSGTVCGSSATICIDGLYYCGNKTKAGKFTKHTLWAHNNSMKEKKAPIKPVKKMEKMNDVPVLNSFGVKVKVERNEYGQWIHKDTGFVVDREKRLVIGKEGKDGQVNDLTLEDCKLCDSLKFNRI